MVLKLEKKMSVSSLFLITEQVSITHMLNFLLIAIYKLIVKRKLIFLFLAPPRHPVNLSISEFLINNEH